MADRSIKKGPPVGSDCTSPVILGIDLGTTYCKVSYVNEMGHADLVRFMGRELQVPSVVTFVNGKPECGSRAVSYAQAFPETHFKEFKRNLPDRDSQGNPLVLYTLPETGQDITPKDLTVIMLDHLKSLSEGELQGMVKACVITVPAYFQDAERRLVREAAEVAGLNVLELLDEPVSASIAYISVFDIKGTFVVFDLGGGTFDVSVVRAKEGEVRVLATGGDRKLGGTDFRMRIKESALEVFESEHGYRPDNVEDQADLWELDTKVTTALHDLSLSDCVIIPVRIRTHQTNFEISREEFDRLTAPIVEETIGITRQVLVDAGLDLGVIDHFLLVGGASRIARIETALSESFGRPVKAMKDREFAVAKGAAIQAVNLSRESSDKSLAGKAKSLPAKRIKAVKRTAHPLCVEIVDPAHPQSERGLHHVMIPAQSEIPCEREELFTPVGDFQDSVEVVVCQGAEGMPVEPRSISGMVHLPLSPALPRAQRLKSIRVKYSMDGEARIHVLAKDLLSGVEVVGEVGLPDPKVAVS